MAAILVTVGGDHPLADAPGRLDLDMSLVGEQGGETVDPLVGQQPCTGVEGPTGFIPVPK
ncbi:MAG: hypothetical protein JSS88_11030 [Actinobacteria bacterium]|nr:hypothetical protein [Actinomycetota bacterium]